jgi:hypothetical protein
MFNYYFKILSINKEIGAAKTNKCVKNVEALETF